MASEIINALRHALEEGLKGITLVEDSLEAGIDARYGDVVLEIDHDLEAESIRVSVDLPPPPGAGTDFLIWCLTVNTQYWDVKIGLDEDGLLVFHGDLDVVDEADVNELAQVILDRAETITELIDDDLTEWLLERGLGTPGQQERWLSRAKPKSED